MNSIYFDELEIGQEFISPGRTITETDVVMFASLSGDMNELHTNQEYAKHTQFEKPIVHGLLGLSICHGLMFRLGLFEQTAIAFLNVENWKFTAPIFYGDTVHAKFTVQEKVHSRSKDDRGIIKFSVQLINQDDEITQEGVKVIMMKRKQEKNE
ncbi:MaoC/PaaZ C-terminal domain-containing protein [Thalassobacillus sp. C254]|uniref:MaoC/PaaZ C-terminal domain-containing protein n=1 Tax=Thalassobacillus sp. C254 TaxID=1225341 RepID=UPI0006D07311|nr:MaoC/PaaZ C-terminal domain-containing protein [Thalassobacillus sp. C254]